MDEKKSPPKEKPSIAPAEPTGDAAMRSRMTEMNLGEQPEGEGFQVCLPHPAGRICHSRDDCVYQERLDRQARERARLRDL